VRRLAVKLGAVDHPSDRKVHPSATPTAGGLALLLGVLAGFGASAFIPSFDVLHKLSDEPRAVVAVAVVIVAIGAFDDIKGLPVVGKLAGQIAAAGLLVLLGVQLLYLWFPGAGIISLSSDLAVPLTILWIVVMTNAINFIDGLDGLAAGMVAIAAVAFFLFVYRDPVVGAGTSAAALICAITAGACIGFLPWNFNPAKIFMGDTGAMLLGLLLAVATMSAVGRSPFPPSAGELAAFSIPLLVPLLVLAIPFLDLVLAVIRRFRRGRALTHADKQHIHHQLLDLGHSHREAVLLMYLWSALISGAALAVAFIDGRLLIGAILLAEGVVFAVTVVPRVLQYFAMTRRHRSLLGERPRGEEDRERNARQPA